ncbi:DUF3800 domain-containing protein [Lichenibacterium ramalinae]|uniref:DUF3800 domain-containing protein n=1 Tax=Lichenibacterium ramalinae TaxID=2316527 RepID=A0A4Q2R6Q4_9HYPH|nr:DUF3800 domain-containing protein [Lichenibacterium ramalinae]RYB02062.1 DUF3800 domain-containing protein [Lichenibacterium ramalinae]
MSWLLFVDEPSDRQVSSPYGVLTGLAVEDVHVWSLSQRLKDAQQQFFGQQLIDHDGRYAEARALLGLKVYESAALHPRSDDLSCSLASGFGPQARLTNSQVSAALAQAKIAYCDCALSLARDFGAIAFAMFFPADAIPTRFEDRLRKDYGFLLERYYHFLKSRAGTCAGLIVLPRQPRGQTYVASGEIVDYFAKTANGRVRSRLIIPNPVYADGPLDIVSHLTELVSYVANWSIRLPNMHAPRRPEMGPLTARCSSLRFAYAADNGKKDWSFKYIDDLRPAAPVVPAGAPRQAHL